MTDPTSLSDPEMSGCSGTYGVNFAHPPHGPYPCKCPGYSGKQDAGGRWPPCETMFPSPYVAPPAAELCVVIRVTCML